MGKEHLVWNRNERNHEMAREEGDSIQSLPNRWKEPAAVGMHAVKLNRMVNIKERHRHSFLDHGGKHLDSHLQEVHGLLHRLY